MFLALGNAVSRWWPAFLAAWLIILGSTFFLAPPWNEVARDREFAFLPADKMSRRGEELFKKSFPDQMHPSIIALVAARSNGKLTEQDKSFVAKDLTPGLLHIKQEEENAAKASDTKPVIAVIHTFKEMPDGPLLVSADGQATLVVLELNSELLEQRNRTTLGRIESLLKSLRDQEKVPEGLEIGITGNGTIGADITDAEAATSQITQTWTAVLVIVLLLLIYRAPLLALVPLATVFVAVEVALRFLSLLAEANILGLFQGVQIFLTIIIYGTGVDYCFFLIARYREELEKIDGGPPTVVETTPGCTACPQAMAAALAKVGPTLVASAATVTLGIGMMTFAQFGQFHEAGIAIASSLIVGLLAVLTLTPALLRLIGRWAFWPARPQRRCHATGADQPSGAGLPAGVGIWPRVANLLRRRPVTVWFGTVALMLPLAVIAILNFNNVEIGMLKRLPPDSRSIVGTKLLDRHFPGGITGPVIVLIRSKDINFHDDRGQEMIATLSNRLIEQKKSLGVADIRSSANPLGVTNRAQDAQDQMILYQHQHPENKRGFQDMLQQAQNFYAGGTDTAQLQITLKSNPLGRPSIHELGHLEKAIDTALPPELKNADILFLGQTASLRDLTETTHQDQTRIEVLVMLVVFAVLVILLRRLVVSVYLILSVLLSYFTTLGVAYALFWALDPAGFTGLDWKVPIFLFTILVAVGEDYNIFLLTRVREEQREYGPVEGVTHALVKTGRIITSCGIIMAGTFSSLIAGSLLDLRQLGFALAFGVLLDTLVVRPILVPTFLIVLNGRKKQPEPVKNSAADNTKEAERKKSPT